MDYEHLIEGTPEHDAWMESTKSELPKLTKEQKEAVDKLPKKTHPLMQEQPTKQEQHEEKL